MSNTNDLTAAPDMNTRRLTSVCTAKLNVGDRFYSYRIGTICELLDEARVIIKETPADLCAPVGAEGAARELERWRMAAELCAADVAFFGGNDAKFLLLCNDTFYYASGDGEVVPLERVPEIYAIYKDRGEAGLIEWIATKRDMRPLPEVEEYLSRAKQIYNERNEFSAEVTRLQAELDHLRDTVKNKIAWHRDGVGPDVPVLQPRYDNLRSENERLQAEVERLKDELERTTDKIVERSAKLMVEVNIEGIQATARAEAIRECADKVRNAYDLTYGDGDGLRIIDTRGLDALAALLEGENNATPKG